MASGVKVDDECVLSFERLKTQHSAKFCIFKLNDKYDKVIFDKELKRKPRENMFNCFEGFVKNLPADHCRYGAFVYGGRTDTEDKPVDKVVFVSWAPGCCKLKEKMVHASTLSAVKSKLKLGDVIQCTDLDDLEESNICAKTRVKLNEAHRDQERELHPFCPEQEEFYDPEKEHCEQQQMQM